MALGSMLYVPVVKAREAEIKALLNTPAPLDVTPLFELQATLPGQIDQATGIRKRTKGPLTDASYFLDDIARLWDAPLYVDISRVSSPSQRELWWKLLDVQNRLAPVSAELIPVLVPDEATGACAAAGAAASVTGRLAVRFPMPNYLGSTGAMSGVVARISAEASIPVKDIDVFIDWTDQLENHPLDDIETTTHNALTALSGQHGAVITLGTPNSDDFVQVGTWDRPRREWWLWLRLAHGGYDVVYGDYVLYPPSDPVPVGPSYGHLRYSSDDRLHVFRRARPATGGGITAAFRECCSAVVAETYFLGRGFSKADRRIDDINLDADKESQAGKWRQIAEEHHFALVAAQLASPSAAPPAGTL